MKRFALRLALALVLVVSVAAAFAAWVLATPSGTRFAWRHAETLLPYEIELASLDGRMLGPLTLNGLVLRNERFEIELERARLDWHPAALLTGTLDIERLELAGLDVLRRSAESEPAEDGAGRELSARLAPPIAVIVRRVAVEDLRYRTRSGDPVVVTRARLAGRWTDDELLVSELEADGPRFEIGGRARIVPSEPYDTDARFEWSFEPPGYAAAVGTTEITGDLRTLTIEQRVERPYNVSANIEVASPLTALSLDGRARLEVELADLGAELPAATLTADLRLDGPPARLGIAADARLDAPDVDALALSLRAVLTGETLVVETLDARHAASGAELTAEGRAVLGAMPRLELDGTWTGLQWPLAGEPLVASDAGSLRVAGALDDYDVELRADLATSAASGIPAASGRVRVSGSGSARALQLAEIELEALGGRLAGMAELRMDPAIGADVELTMSDVDPQRLAEQWPGRIDGRLGASAELDEQGRVSARIDELSLDGRLRDRELNLAARGTYMTGTLRLESLSLVSGSTTIEADGTIADDADVEFSLDSPDLADLWPGAAGRLTLTGRLTGPRARPVLALDATGRTVDVRGARIENLMLSTEIDIAGERNSRIDLSVREAALGGRRIQALELTGSGNAASHELNLRASTSAGDARLGVTGGVERVWQPDAVWRFELATASFEPATLGAWQLRAPSSGHFGRADAALDETCWRSGEAELCVDAERTSERTAASATLSELPFAYLAGLLATPVEVEGDLSASGELVALPGTAPRLSLSLESTRGRVTSSSSRGAALDFGPLDGRLDADAERLEASLRLPLGGDGDIDVTARVGGGTRGAPFDARSLDGRVTARMDDLGLVSDVSARVQDAQGSLRGDLDLAGTLGAPSVSGRFALEDASALLPGPNVRVENVTLELTGDGGGDIAISAHAASGGGTLDVDGRVELAAAGPLGELDARGENFELVDTLDMQILVSPDLRLMLGAERIDLTGSVTVPRASITSGAPGGDVVPVSRDQVIVGDEDDGNLARQIRPVHANVTLELGDEVGIDAMGLSGTLSGAIEITDVPEEPTTASGELRIEGGTYEAYGQQLDVRTGRLLFAGGPIERPGLDIEAVRRPTEDILVGARVRGTLEQPELGLFSEPSMQQREQLSYLVLGRPLEGASSAESSAVSRAALALGLRGGNFVSERINQNLGLDEFGIQAQPGEPSSAASFVIGKYLSPSLYVSYGVGLFDSVSTLKLRYEISDRWQLVTESSDEGSGGDVVYNIERAAE